MERGSIEREVARVVRVLLGLLLFVIGAAGCHEVLGTFETEPPVETAGQLCEPQEFRCNGEYLLRCNGDGQSWALEKACATAGQCDSRGGRCTLCEDGDLRCNGANRESCRDDGGGWQELEACASMALCNDGFCGNCPTPGELRCAGPDRTQLEQCGRDRTWVALDACVTEALCEKTLDFVRQAQQTFAGSCEAPVCDVTGAYSCDGVSLRRCNASRASWTNVGACASATLCSLRAAEASATAEAGAIVDRCEEVCTAGQFRCTGAESTTLERCGDDSAAWELVETCPEQTQCDPVNGECSGPCAPGELRCNGPLLEQCDARETWQPSETCLSAALCFAEKDPNSGTWAGRCDPPAEGCSIGDQHRCNPDNPAELQRCTDDLTTWQPVETCRSGALCNPVSKRCDQPPDGCADTLGTRLLRCDPAAPLEVERCSEDYTSWESYRVCAAGEFCFPADIEQPCKTECPSALSCNGAELRRCSAEAGIVHQANCATAALCACATSGTCPAGIGNDGCGLAVCGGSNGARYQCNGTMLQTCRDGRDGWVDTANCGSDGTASLCHPGSAPTFDDAFCAVCPVAGENRCNGGSLRTCSADRSMWVGQNCAYGCVDSGAMDYCAACFGGEARCVGTAAGSSSLRQCSGDRSELVATTTCPLGCFDAGIADVCRSCGVGESRCTSTTQRATCSETPGPPALGPPQGCPQTCIQSGLADFCGVCAPGQTQCSGNGLQTCGSDGSFGAASACANGCIDSGTADFCSPECNPVTQPFSCNANTLRRCDTANGRWATQAECRTAQTPLGVCDAANGECDDCTTGDYSCAGNTLRSCDANGRWMAASSPCQGNTLRTCSSGTLRQSTCALCDANNRECDDCATAGAYSCAGTTLQQCNSTGHLQTVTNNCSANTLRVCPGNAGGTSCTICDEQNDQCDVCVPSEYGCMGNTLRQCSANGQSWVNNPPACGGGVLRQCSNGVRSDTPCPVGETCNAQGNQCTECSAGQTLCFSSGQIQQCSAMLAWGAPTICENGCRGSEPAAYCAECLQSGLRCSPTAPAQPQSCGGSGLWADSGSACSGATPQCSDGACRCTATSCGSSAFCLNGGCVPCNPAMMGATCNVDAVRTCSAGGQWVDTACEAEAPQCIGAGQCVECETSAQCSGTTPFCLGNDCVPCDPQSPVQCVQNQLRSCSMSGQVQSAACGANQLCPEGSNRCVQCVTDTDCVDTPNTPNCLSDTCVECETGEQRCQNGVRQTCSMQTNAWVASPCASGEECIGNGECVSCTTDADCQNPTPICGTSNSCRACTPGECEEGICASGSCVQCATNADCTAAAQPICDGNVCRACTSSADCAGDVCAASGQCVECAMSTDCENPTPVCLNSFCAACTANAQCPDGVCSAGQCVECASSTDCANPTPVCAAGNCTACTANAQCPDGVCSAGQCVECASSTDCANPTPVCAAGNCTACTANAQCPDGVCSAGQCVECASSTDCQNPEPICTDDVCVPCLTDDECPVGTCMAGACTE